MTPDQLELRLERIAIMIDSGYTEQYASYACDLMPDLYGIADKKERQLSLNIRS